VVVETGVEEEAPLSRSQQVARVLLNCQNLHRGIYNYMSLYISSLLYLLSSMCMHSFYLFIVQPFRFFVCRGVGLLLPSTLLHYYYYYYVQQVQVGCTLLSLFLLCCVALRTHYHTSTSCTSVHVSGTLVLNIFNASLKKLCAVAASSFASFSFSSHQ